MRFDRTESPSHINEGKGWTEDHAADWLHTYGLHGDAMSFDDGYIRAKQYDAGRFLDSSRPDDGVLVMRCEKST